MTKVKGVGRTTQLLDDLTNRRRYWKLKEEAKDLKMEITVYQFNIWKYLQLAHGPANTQHT